MATKKRKKRVEPAADELEAVEQEPEVIEEPEPVKAAGPAETTKDKGADEIWWACPHCETRYPKGNAIARANHLERVHPGAK